MRAVTSDSGLFRVTIAGVLLIDDQQHACAMQIEQTAHRTVALEARRLSPRPMPGEEPPSLRLSAPDTMPINNVVHLMAEFVADWQVANDLAWTIIGLSVAPTIDPTVFAATIRLRHDTSEANSLRIETMPPLRRPIEFHWSSDYPVERWLRALRRATIRCPLTHPLFGD